MSRETLHISKQSRRRTDHVANLPLDCRDWRKKADVLIQVYRQLFHDLSESDCEQLKNFVKEKHGE